MLPKAIFSPCRRYRYMLTRQWDATLPYVCFIGLNPSTADENLDDPTIRRCIAFAKRWGYGGIIMINLFAYRATDPRDMKKQLYPHGSENNRWIKEAGKEANLMIACWGTHGVYRERGAQVKRMLQAYFGDMIRLCHLGLTKDGYPKHPLYLKGDLVPIDWA